MVAQTEVALGTVFSIVIVSIDMAVCELATKNSRLLVAVLEVMLENWDFLALNDVIMSCTHTGEQRYSQKAKGCCYLSHLNKILC